MIPGGGVNGCRAVTIQRTDQAVGWMHYPVLGLAFVLDVPSAVIMNLGLVIDLRTRSGPLLAYLGCLAMACVNVRAPNSP